MSDEAITKPTIETLLERVNLVLDENRALREAIEIRLDGFREVIEIRLDRIESEVKITHSELFSLRADFKELRAGFHEFRSQFKQPT
jgi:hypothetical protein